MNNLNLDLKKFEQTSRTILYSSDILKLDMIEFFKPKDKREKGLLFGNFSKHHHGKIQDAYSCCLKGFKNTGDVKYKSLLYLNAIIRNLK